MARRSTSARTSGRSAACCTRCSRAEARLRGDHTSDIIATSHRARGRCGRAAARDTARRVPAASSAASRRIRDGGCGTSATGASISRRDVSAPTFEMPATRKRWALIGLATCVFTVLAAAALLIYLRPAPPAAPISFTVEAPPEHVFEDTPVPSPRGDRLAFVARSAAGESALWLRSLDSPVPRHIPGTEDAIRVFWSPDGRSLGFMTTMHLKRVDPEGGPVQVIATAAPPVTGATWNGDGTIVFAPTNRAPLHRVAAGGGAPEPVTALDAARGENSHRWPHFLPDGRHFLFTARAALAEHTGIDAGSLDSPAVTWLLQAQSSAIYLSTGHLLFVREGVLLAHASTRAPSSCPATRARSLARSRTTRRAHWRRSRPPRTAVCWFGRRRDRNSSRGSIEAERRSESPDRVLLFSSCGSRPTVRARRSSWPIAAPATATFGSWSWRPARSLASRRIPRTTGFPCGHRMERSWCSRRIAPRLRTSTEQRRTAPAQTNRSLRTASISTAL